MKSKYSNATFVSHKKHRTGFKLLDRFGFTLSMFCLAHCILVPVLLLLLPSYSIFLGSLHGNIHFYLYFVILPVSLLAFIPRAIIDKQWEFLWGPGCAIILLGMTMYLHDKQQLPLATFSEPFLTSIASLALVYFHWRNFKLRNHKCPKC